MSITVYHLNVETLVPFATFFEDDELVAAMKFMEVLRKEGHRHVTFSSVHGDQVGLPGVDSVEDGKTPDGEAYDWSKADRAGRVRRSERLKWAEDAKKV